MNLRRLFSSSNISSYTLNGIKGYSACDLETLKPYKILDITYYKRFFRFTKSKYPYKLSIIYDKPADPLSFHIILDSDTSVITRYYKSKEDILEDIKNMNVQNRVNN